MTRVLLLVNPTASSVTARNRVIIRKLLADHHDVEVAETSRRGHAIRLARAAANDGFGVVAVFAGDGTLNEAADGLSGTGTALAPLPGGSTNVYARTLGVPLDPVAATTTLLASLQHGRFRRIGVGRVDGRRFLFHTGLGFDAAVIRRVERYGELKRYASHPLHIVAAFETWFRHFDHSKPRFDLVLETGERIEGVYFAIVSKTTPYTYLGRRPIRVTDDAGLDRFLAVTAFRSIGVLMLMRAAASALGMGSYLQRSPDIVQRHGLRRLRVEGRGPFPYQADGDDLGDVDNLDIDDEPDALTIVIP